ncbi:MAG: hypothetical protein LBN25_03400 [Christensenellaceae bacterium]|jgi:hypothetical protein|nr:hypothetical protein [Christensenellaceae bacterium]
MKKVVLPLIALIFLGSLVIVSMIGLKIRYSYTQWVEPTNCEFVQREGENYEIIATKHLDGSITKTLYVKGKEDTVLIPELDAERNPVMIDAKDADGNVILGDDGKPVQVAKMLEVIVIVAGQSVRLDWEVYRIRINDESKQPELDENGEPIKEYNTTPLRSAVTLRVVDNNAETAEVETPKYMTRVISSVSNGFGLKNAEDEEGTEEDGTAEEPSEEPTAEEEQREEFEYVLTADRKLAMENEDTAGKLTLLRDVYQYTRIQVTITSGAGYEIMEVVYVAESKWDNYMKNIRANANK